MSKNISRRDFLKSAALGAVGVGMLGRGFLSRAGAEEAKAIYKAGTVVPDWK